MPETDVSSRQLAKILAVDKNTAWLMIARIDHAMANQQGRNLLLKIFEDDRRKAEGRRQKAEGRNTIFALCQKGHKPLNLFMKK